MSVTVAWDMGQYTSETGGSRRRFLPPDPVLPAYEMCPARRVEAGDNALKMAYMDDERASRARKARVDDERG